MSDPLAQLQAALARGSSTALAVEMRDATGAPTNDFAHLASFFFSGSGAQFPRDTLTRYTVKELLGGGSLAGAAAINATPNYYPLDAVYFAYVKRDVGHADYFQECQRLGIKMVQLTQKSDLFEYLDNTQATSKYVDTSALDPNQRSIVAAAAVPFNAEDQQVLKRAATDAADDAEEKRARVATTAIRPLATSLVQEQSAIDRAKEITDAEHVLVDRSTVTSCPLMNKSFETARRLAVDIILKSELPASGKDGSTRGAPSKGISSHTSRAPTISGSASSVNVAANTLPFIIIVPAALTAQLTLFNIKQFLEGATYVSTDEARQAAQNRKTSPVIVTHKNTRTPGMSTFHIVDSVEKIRQEDWERVVAVFVIGQKWQFRGWKWEDPAELFHHVKGFHLKYSDSQVDTQVKQWNVTTLEVNRYKRHMDAQCVYQFWTAMDQYITTKKSFLLPNTNAVPRTSTI